MKNLQLTKSQTEYIYFTLSDEIVELMNNLIDRRVFTKKCGRNKVIKWLSDRDKELLANYKRCLIIKNKLEKILGW